MTKRVLSLVLVFLLVLTSLQVVFADSPMDGEPDIGSAIFKDICGEHLYYTLTSDGFMAIEGYGPMYDYSPENPAPWTPYAKTINYIKVQQGEEGPITSIGDYAFNGLTALERIEFVDHEHGLQKIGKYAFYGCTGLRYVVGIENVFMPEASVGEYAFAECSNLATFDLPRYVHDVKEGTFKNCTELKTVESSGVTRVEDYAFYNCEQLTSFTPNDSIWGIGDYAFYNCKALKSINFMSTSLIEIGKYAFAGCLSAQEIFLPLSVTEIGDHAFMNNVSAEFANFPEYVTYIPSYGYAGCRNLRSITIKGKIAHINAHAFDGCENLHEISMEDGVKQIDKYAFANCGSIRNLFLPITIDAAKTGAFNNTHIEDLYVFNPECELSTEFDANWENGLPTHRDITIHGFRNSRAHNFAGTYGYTFEALDTGFADVKESAYYAIPVTYMRYRGWMKGTGDKEFSPYITMSRAMVVTVLWRMAGSPQTYNAMPFEDVKTGAYYENAVRWAYSTGVIAGTSDTTFSPNNDMTREQLATILFRYAAFNGMSTSSRADLSRFEDSKDISSWARIPMEWAVETGIINGTSDTTLSPKGAAQRCQAATMLVRYITNAYPCLIK
ncbi:MAG: leucine-rich repeat protein [Lachnospiraceae bacterium]|nr:leucine-rich repeat protein [Lachnospiraceae bacterium]